MFWRRLPVFHRRRGNPIYRKTVLMHLRKALINIGITAAEIKDRNLHIHAWRHFSNTEMLKGEMTERYTHFDPLEFV